MGTSYSYTVVVEPDQRLFINEQVVPTSPEAIRDDVLGWALEQVRETYASYYANDQSSELTLKVEDRRPGGVKRRAKFTHPDGGISLAALRGEQPAPVVAAAPSPPPPPPPARLVTQTTPEPADPLPTRDLAPDEVVDPEQQLRPVAAPAPQAPRPAVADDPMPDSSPAAGHPAPATAASTPAGPRGLSRDEHLARERGWQPLDQGKVTRPQIGSAENEGRSKGVGLMREARRQKWVQSLLIALAILAVVAGFRVFNSGTSFEAYCVDQRTMTRVVTGVACEDPKDTNHRWWYTSDEKGVPEVGDSIDAEAGTFDAPNGEKDTVNKHIERGD